MQPVKPLIAFRESLTAAQGQAEASRLERFPRGIVLRWVFGLLLSHLSGDSGSAPPCAPHPISKFSNIFLIFFSNFLHPFSHSRHPAQPSRHPASEPLQAGPFPDALQTGFPTATSPRPAPRGSDGPGQEPPKRAARKISTPGPVLIYLVTGFLTTI